jgi:transcriptional regulator with XRE-family HTH domain
MMAHPLETWFKETGTSKVDFAEAHGVSRMAIWRVVSGDASVSLAMLRKISGATGIPLADLLPETKEAAQ